MSFGFGFGFPSQAPTSGGATLDFNFVGATTLDPRITFTRALNTATYFDSTGTLRTANANVARFDYDPSTLAPRGLLIEEARTNLLTYNSEFDNVAWTKSNASISADSIASPDGNVNADKLVEDTATNTHLVQPSTSPTYTSGVAYTYSVYAKKAERTFLQLRVTAGSIFSASFDLDTGLASQVAASTTASMVFVSNGWYRCSISYTATSTAAGASRIGVMQNATTQNYTGDGTSGIYIWGAQLEVGAFATSVIPTSTVAVSRANDDANVNTLAPWYNQSEGTLFVEGVGVNNVGGATRRYAQFNDVALTDRLIVGYSATTASRFLVQDNAATVADISVTATTGGGLVKIAAAYAVNDYQQATNGVLGTADVSGTLPTVTKLTLGSETSTTNTYLNGYIRRITYYPRRLANTELQAITA